MISTHSHSTLFSFLLLCISFSPLFALEEELEESPPADTARIQTSSEQINSPLTDSATSIPKPIELLPKTLEQKPLILEVDTKIGSNASKNLGTALGLTFLLPGSGESYLNSPKSAKAFWLTESAFWATLYIGWIAKEQYLHSARNYASAYAGAQASNKDEDFLELLALYRSYSEKENRQDSYEMSQLLSGKSRSEFAWSDEATNRWDWGPSSNPENTKNWRKYQSVMRYHRAAKLTLTYGVGALILNRLASIINVLHLYRSTSGKSLAFNILPEFDPTRAGAKAHFQF